MVFYKLVHIHEKSETEKELGLYTTPDAIREAKAFYLTKPGFRDFPEGFLVLRRESTAVAPERAFYEAMVYCHSEDYETEFCEELGYYAEKSEAEAAIAGFEAMNPNIVPNMVMERIVNRCFPDQRLWVEGFDFSDCEESIF